MGMKHGFLTMLALGAMLSAAAADPAPELAPDGGFESGSLSGWGFYPRNATGWYGLSDSTEYGKQCLRLTGHAEAKNFVAVRVVPTLERGKEYLLQFRVRPNVKDPQGKSFEFGVTQELAKGGTICRNTQKINLKKSEWQSVAMRFTPTNPRTEKFSLYADGKNLAPEDEILIDEVSLTLAPEETNPELVADGGFENGNLGKWQFYPRNVKGWYQLSDDTDYGVQCLALTGHKDFKSFEAVHPVKPLEQGKEYLLRCRVRPKVKNPAGKEFELSVLQEVAKGGTICRNGQKFNLKKDLWQYAEVRFTVTDQRSKKFSIYAGGRNLAPEDLILVDEISLTLAPETKVKELVYDGGLETGDLRKWAFYPRGKEGWYGLSDETDYGNQCLCLTGHADFKEFTAVLPVPLLEQGKEYMFRFRVRAQVADSTDKELRMMIRQEVAKGGTLCCNQQIIDLGNPAWQYGEVRFGLDKRAGRFSVQAVGKNLTPNDKIFIDELSLLEVSEVAAPFDPAAPSAGPHETVTKENFTYTLDAKTGIMNSLTIDGEVIHPLAANSGVVFVQKDFQETKLDGRGTPSAEVPFSAKAAYTLEKDGVLRETVTVIATADAAGPFKIGVRHGFDAAKALQTISALHPVRVLPATQSTVFAYNSKRLPNEQDLSLLDKFQYVVVPLAVLETPQSYVMTGSLQIDEPLTFAINQPQNYFPSIQRNLLTVKKGDTFRFETNYKRFDKEHYLLRDVWRFYGDHTRSAEPVLADLIPPRYTEPRTFYYGPNCAHTYFLKSREERMFPNANVWFYSWHDIVHERYPVSGEWYSEGKSYNKVTAEEVKAHIDHLQNDLNVKAAMYIRSLANLRDSGTTFPEAWFVQEAGGAVNMYGGGYELPVPEKSEAYKDGFKTVQWGSFDLNNPEYFKFFDEELFKVLDFYRPAAIGFDCMVSGGNNARLRFSAHVYDRLRKEGRPVKVCINEAGLLSQAYCDQVDIENGLLGGKSVYDFEVSRAYTTSIVCEERYNLADLAVKVYFSKERCWLDPKGLANNARYLDYLIQQHPELKEDRKTLSHHSQIRMCLYDLGLGATPGYMEECKPIPPSLVAMAGDVNALFAVNKSFALRLPSGSDHDGLISVSAWSSPKTLRIALWNDDGEAHKTTLRLNRKDFAELGWEFEKFASVKAVQITPEGETPAEVQFTADGDYVKTEVELPPFTGLLFFGGEPVPIK